MELSELMNRIVRRHAPLFVVFFLAGVGIGLFLPLSNHSEYPAVARAPEEVLIQCETISAAKR